MKKNFTINLFGVLYNIDEDAYELLDSYQRNMRAYFSRRDGGEEVCEDIEHRVAELLSDMKAEGVEAVNIDHVRSIIRRIGNPEDMTGADEPADTPSDGGGEGPTTPPPPPEPERPRRRLFRDPQDKMLGGVLSGLCKFFGGNDPLPWRIIFLLLCLLSWTSLAVVYVVLWALMPEARTAEERLQMCGKPVNPQTLNEEIMRGVDATRNFVNAPAMQARARGCLGTFLSVVVACLKAFGIFFLACLLLGLLFVITLFCFALLAGGKAVMAAGLPYWGWMEVSTQAPALSWLLIVFFVAAFTSVALPLYALIRSFLRRPDSKPASAGRHMVFLIVWLLAVALAIITGIATGSFFDDAMDRIEQVRPEAYQEADMRSGIYLTGGSWGYLKQGGWVFRPL
ncbi:MAG: PspC domain-containing protein [Alloprevotella sp.]|nr:PspC domain-containing protein [Alloprevotella sp.]